ncbi:Succinyl-CoA--L-malate CoA-transferase beta subunit [invertebrate metagenome]|uniref:Succinyl-CoA--L-malate CoA-transferase beta subunit n=1 Tax=invertebrate metagenome TaxID=1711999 RepID=A0A2H9TAR2_9ZZZZ
MSAFNISDSLKDFCRIVGMNPAEDAFRSLRFEGCDPVLPTRLRFGAIYGIPAAAAALGIAGIWHERTGTSQNVCVDLVQAAHMVADSPYSSLNGMSYHLPFVFVPGQYDCPYALQFYPTKDHRLFAPAGFYPHMERKWSEFLSVPATHDAVSGAIRLWEAEALQEACNRQGLVGSYVRTKEEWSATEAGRALSQVPVVRITKIAESEPIPWADNPTQPLSGIKVLGNTHEIAGPIVTRALAGQGADGLQVSNPKEFWHEHVYLQAAHGVRQAAIDLQCEKDAKVFSRLAREADVFIENYRTAGTTAQDNFVPECLVRHHKGLIYVKIHGIAFDGMPWADRGCFDPLAIPMTGISSIEGSLDHPVYPVGGFLCDNMTGLLAVPAILQALKRRASEGGSYLIEASLCRTAMWAMDLGVLDKMPDNLPTIKPELMKIEGKIGTMLRPAPAVHYSETPDHWSHGLSYRGADAPEWL